MWRNDWDGGPFYLDPWVYFAPQINYEGTIVGWQLVHINFDKVHRNYIDRYNRDTLNEET